MPLRTFRSASAFTASLTGAFILSVSSVIVSEASPSESVVAPDFMPFLPFAVMFSVPEPDRVTFEPSLNFMTAFSASALSGKLSSLFCSESDSEFVPRTTISTSEDFAQVIGAVDSPESVRLSSTSVTPVVPFFTLTEPSEQLPVRI